MSIDGFAYTQIKKANVKSLTYTQKVHGYDLFKSKVVMVNKNTKSSVML